MRLLAFSGSLRAVSINTALLEAARRLAPEGVEIVLYRGIADLPPFNPDFDRDPPPAAALALRAMIGASDGLLIAAPEYAHGLPGAFKNALDWLVGSTEFPGKPVMLINAAPRAFHAQANLREILATMSAHLVTEAFVTAKAPSEAASVEVILAEEALTAALRAGLYRFLDVLRAQAPGARSAPTTTLEP
jgi:chromate reductase, NAD(P)H dehydrogenase (quinone)